MEIDICQISLEMDDDKQCCICLESKLIPTINGEDTTLYDVSPYQFPFQQLPDNVMFLNPCRQHHLCIECMRSIINNYENHPINEDNSHFSCPYPFQSCETSIGFKHIFEHSLILKVCRTDSEWEAYMNHAEQYAFPGFITTKCPCPVRMSYEYQQCNSDVLISIDDMKSKEIGDLIAECTQNEVCQRKFCYHCKHPLAFYESYCQKCKVCYENEAPELLNYYFNKNINAPIADTIYEDATDYRQLLTYNENDYLYYNKDITVDIAVKSIEQVITDHSLHMICAICKAAMFKTEKCNAMSHHGVERCYACGRVGYRIKGLGEHWSGNGDNGCFRFDNDEYIKTHVSTYMCCELICSNHELGDCTMTEHQDGIRDFEKMRTKAYVYHMLKSLLPEIRFIVWDTLYNLHIKDDNFIWYLPYKQTLCLLQTYKTHNRHYSEDILYQKLGCQQPGSLTIHWGKEKCIEVQTYIDSYPLPAQEIQHEQNRDEDVDFLEIVRSTLLRRIIDGRGDFILLPDVNPDD